MKKVKRLVFLTPFMSIVKLNYKIGQGAVKRSFNNVFTLYIHKGHNVEIKNYLDFFLILVPLIQL